MTKSLKNYPKFKLGASLTKEQIDFFNKNGFVHFTEVLSSKEVDELIAGYEAAQEKLIKSKEKTVKGIPVIFGHDENGKRIVQRFPYTSYYSDRIKQLVLDPRIQGFKHLLTERSSRVTDTERDGVVFNHYVNSKHSRFKQMGWHTDSIREVFYGRKVFPTLNIGIYLDNSSAVNGGLRVLPATHTQGLFGMLFTKMYYRNTKEDKNEVLVVAKPGDVVVHHGHIWHRVGHSEHTDSVSRRRVMYIPVLCGPKQRKKPAKPGKTGKTPIYHHLHAFAKFDQ
ncbi:MAG TPA: phytanoyl-CoA dioxygenase family protein [Bacteroidia bacterium]|jgi:ectoine hydroxylase-related dioxygenase (phytanoyl-CoA dioxygenase family)|nr:phytanoyl-CoA dioxygenase family protein [Bacteroidia bacterium]